MGDHLLARSPQSQSGRSQKPEALSADTQSKVINPLADRTLCVTCSDLAVVVRIIELLPDGMARVDASCAIEEVNVELIEAATTGDLVLVHAKTAIGKVMQYS
jgi:hydrogenase maturation factor